jgi:hypothetical protein
MQFECVKELASRWEADPKIPLPLNRDSSFQLYNESFDENVLFTIWDAALRAENGPECASNSLALSTACRSEMVVANKEYLRLVEDLQLGSKSSRNSSCLEEKEGTMEHPFVTRAIVRVLAMRCVVGAIFRAVSDNVSLIGEELYRSIVSKAISTWGGKHEDYILQYTVPPALQLELMAMCTDNKSTTKPVQQLQVSVGDGIGVCAWLCALLRLLDVLLLTLQAAPHDEELSVGGATATSSALTKIRKATALNPDDGRTLYNLRIKRRASTGGVRKSSTDKPPSVQALDHLVAECLWGVAGPGNKLDFETCLKVIQGRNLDVVSYITLQHSESGALIVFPFLASWDSAQTPVSWGQLVVQSSQLWNVTRPYFKVGGETCITTPAEYHLWKKSSHSRCNLLVFEHFNPLSTSQENSSKKLTGSLLADAARYGPYIPIVNSDDDSQAQEGGAVSTSIGKDKVVTTTTVEHDRRTKELDFFLSTKLHYPNGTKTYTQRQMDVGESSADLAAKNRAKLQALLAEEESLTRRPLPVEEAVPHADEVQQSSPRTIPQVFPDDHLSKIYARMAPEVKKAGISMLQSPYKCNPNQGDSTQLSGGLGDQEADVAAECDKILKDLYKSSRSRAAATTSVAGTSSEPTRLDSEAQQHLRRLVRLS